jgi:hypothetical protein
MPDDRRFTPAAYGQMGSRVTPGHERLTISADISRLEVESLWQILMNQANCANKGMFLGFDQGHVRLDGFDAERLPAEADGWTVKLHVHPSIHVPWPAYCKRVDFSDWLSFLPVPITAAGETFPSWSALGDRFRSMFPA